MVNTVFCRLDQCLDISSIGVARILDWGEGQTRNHIGEDQKKESSQFDLGFVIGEGRAKFSWRPILDRGGANLKLQSDDQTYKTNELKISTS